MFLEKQKQWFKYLYVFTFFLSTFNGATSTQCSFTGDEERILKKFSKRFEFVFLFTLGKIAFSSCNAPQVPAQSGS